MSETTYEEYRYAYPFRLRQHFSKAARLRREQIRLFHRGIQVRKPFWRFLSASCWLWFIANITVWMMFWVFTEVTLAPPQTWMFFFFLVYTTVSSLFLAAVMLHGLVMRHWSTSPKVKVGTAPLLPCGDLIVGGTVRNVKMRKSKADASLEDIALEGIACGYVKRTQYGLTKASGPFILGKATQKGAEGQATCGVMLGQDLLFIPAHGKWYLAGDMKDWRLSVLLDTARAMWGEAVTDASIICDATDTFDWRIPNMPAEEPYTRRELYEALAYAKRKGRQLGDYVQDERDTDRMRAPV